MFETGYRIAVFFLTMQMVHGAVTFVLKKQNFSYLTAENYGEFLASPLCILLFFGILIFLLFLFLDGGFCIAFRISVFLSEKKTLCQ